MERRQATERVFLVIGVIAVALGLLAGYVHDTVSDSAEFADRAADAYSSPIVREEITDAVVDRMVAQEPELVAVQPLLETVVDAVLGAEAGARLLRGAVEDLHRTVLGEETDTLTMQLADVILIAKTQLTALDPEAGALIPDQLTDAIVTVSTEPVFVDAIQVVDNLRVVALLLPLLGALAFIGVVWLAPSPAGALVRVGLALIAAAVLASLVERLARAIAIGDGPHSDVAGAVWDAFAADLGTWTLVTAGIGGVLAMVAWFGVGRTEQAAISRRIAAVLQPREAALERVLWGLGATVIGVVFIIEWRLVLQFSVTVAGAALVTVGVREAAAVLAPGLVEGAGAVAKDRPATGEPTPPAGREGSRWLTSVALGLAAVLAVGALARASDGDAAADGDGCNGSDELCDRRLDDVVLAATHNSHAAAEDGFLLGYQREGLEAQLEAGVRALLIDVYFGRNIDGTVVTDRAPLSEDEREELVDEVGESAVRSAEATAARADTGGVERELFLCHALCEIGASRFSVALETIDRFLDDNPGEVLVLIIQDEGPRPDDIAEELDAAGLLDRLHSQAIDQPWPTLGELIEAETPIVVFAENGAGDHAWYHDAFSYIQDTPFSFETAADFSCELNRGEADHPLFLVNHWLSPASPTSAAEVNDALVLVERFEICSDERGQRPNMIAVDFATEGELVETVAELNDS